MNYSTLVLSYISFLEYNLESDHDPYPSLNKRSK